MDVNIENNDHFTHECSYHTIEQKENKQGGKQN